MLWQFAWRTVHQRPKVNHLQKLLDHWILFTDFCWFTEAAQLESYKQPAKIACFLCFRFFPWAWTAIWFAFEVNQSDRSTFGATPRKLGWFSQWLPCMSTLQDLQLVWGHGFWASRFREDFPYRDVWRSNLIRTNRIWSNGFFHTHIFFKKRYTDTLISICNVCMLFSRHNINPSLPCTYVCVLFRVYRGDGENQKKANARHVPRCWRVSGQWQRR